LGLGFCHYSSDPLQLHHSILYFLCISPVGDIAQVLISALRDFDFSNYVVFGHRGSAFQVIQAPLCRRKRGPLRLPTYSFELLLRWYMSSANFSISSSVAPRSRPRRRMRSRSGLSARCGVSASTAFLSSDQAHLESVLRSYLARYHGHRPHRGWTSILQLRDYSRRIMRTTKSSIKRRHPRQAYP
jgi:hypothetical protein